MPDHTSVSELSAEIRSLNDRLSGIIALHGPSTPAKILSQECLDACEDLRMSLGRLLVSFPHPAIPEPALQVEHDLTSTGGRPSPLRCPFSRSPAGGTQTSVSRSGKLPSQDGRPPDALPEIPDKCPIRQLDHTSPEVVASYLQTHKHELPRSHALCVRRYQSNTESIRRLDEKYENLVSMVQDLGATHMRMLPVEDEPARSKTSRTNERAVNKWMDDLPECPTLAEVDQLEIEPAKLEEVEALGPKMRAVRVGESPTRPWGIPRIPDPKQANG